MKYMFILGRNVNLSLAEIFSYFESQNRIISYSLKQNAVLIELEKKLSAEIIKELGGVIAIGEVIASGAVNEILSELKNKEIYFGTKNKLNYAIWNFSDKESEEKISKFLKQKFKSEKLKATEKKFGKSMKLQEGEKIQYLYSKSLIDEQFAIFREKKDYFIRIIETYNPKDIEFRDMNKPVRREALSISPRLAKIMINLSQVKRDEKIVDAFCGIGVILSEALFKGINVVGIDLDKIALSGAKENLDWMGFSESNYKLILDNSSQVKIENVSGLVSEPDFGETLKKIPTKNKAEEMLRRFEKLMIGVLNNLKPKISGKIVFTAPTIKILHGRVGCNIQEILKKTGLNLVKLPGITFPIPEFRKNQIVGREIFVLE